MKTVGFTGTQRGMTEPQRSIVRELLLRTEIEVGYHGGCVGADIDFDDLCYKHVSFVTRVVHPSNIQAKQGKWHYTNHVLREKPPLARNHDIVNSSLLLIATPGEDHEVLRSGTWATIRYAKKRGKVVYIVFPDGTMTKH